MTERDYRLAWRRMVEPSRLPNGVKLTLSKHSERGRHQHHDDAANLHAMSRQRLAAARGKSERTIERDLRRAERDGWLVKHSEGHRGHQAEYHYVTPGSAWLCDCPYRKEKGDVMGARKGDKNRDERATPTAPFESALKGDSLAAPKRTPAVPVAADDETTRSPWNGTTISNDDERVNGFTASARNAADIEQRSNETKPTKPSHTDICPTCGWCYGSRDHKRICEGTTP